MEALNSHSRKQLQDQCQAQIDTRISLGFAQSLDQTPQSFAASYDRAIADILTAQSPEDSYPALVEPRIPFFEQAELIGLEINPAVFYNPTYESWRKPYGTWLKIFNPDELAHPGQNFDQVIANMPFGLRPATPYEALALDASQAQLHTFLLFTGGEFEKTQGLDLPVSRIQTLALERHLGQLRVSQYRLDQYDSLGRVLAAHINPLSHTSREGGIV